MRSKWQSLPTEAINPSSLGIDKLSPAEIVDLMISEDRMMLAAVQRERERIAVGVEIIAAALRKGGRTVFVGAGTSGRLGILESTEMPPTLRSSRPETARMESRSDSAVSRFWWDRCQRPLVASTCCARGSG